MTSTPETRESSEAAAAGNGAHAQAPPKLAEGLELIGKYEDSGFKDPPYIAQRADGQMVQLPELLYAVVDEVDGQAGYEEIADRAGDRIDRELSADNVRYLVEEKLRPLGVIAAADGTSPKIAKADQLLALKFRVSVLPDWVVRGITTVFYPLFFPPVIVVVLAGLVALDVWLFGIHGVGQPARQLMYQPGYLLLVLGLVIASAAFHECGHATACRYGGAKPGVMGAGIYLVWPAFYTDVTDAYRLGKGGRLRTDLGGVYFNAIFSLATAGAYFATGFEPLLIIIVLQHLEMLHQFLPFLRLDGYYIISDLTGVPDMFSRIKPTLRSLIPGRKTEASVEELKPWVRVATTAYVLALIPVLLFVFGFMLISAPRLFATAWDSLFVQWDKISDADGDPLKIAAGGFQTIALLLPVAGLTLTFARTGKRLASGAWGWSSNSVPRRGLVVVLSAVAVASMGWIWWPNGEYKPIQPGERGTVTGGVSALAPENLRTGRPSLTEKREQELGGAPTERSRNAEVDRSEDGTDTPRTETTPGGGTSTTPTTTTPTETTQTTTSPTTTTETATTPTTTTETTTTPTTTTETP